MIQTSDSTFNLQGRTEQVRDIQGSLKAATVFAALVAQNTGGDPLQIEMDQDKTGMLPHKVNI